MNNKLISKCFITFGLLLFFTVLAPLYVANAAEDYRLNLKNVTLAKGTTQTLRVYNVGDNAKIIFKSGDEEIATVNGDGEISANKVGDTIVTVTIKESTGSTNLTCDVTVGPAAVSVKWTQSIVIMSADSVDSLKVILKPSNTVEDAKFRSMNSSVVSVTPGGRITARDFGLAEIRAYINAKNDDGSQKYDSCSVIVTSEENVPKLQKYFNEHTELYDIPEANLRAALSKFFNEEYDPSSSSSLISSLNRYLNNVFDFD